MKDVFYAAWTAFGQLCDNTTVLDELKKEDFIKKCCDVYTNFSKDYMHNVAVNKDKDRSNQKSILDRHKIAAIISIVGAEGYIHPTKTLKEGEILWGQYTIPLVAGLSLVQQDFNNDLHRFKIIKDGIDIPLYIPTPSACDRYYIDSLARNLYYGTKLEEETIAVRIMDLANIFFLLEECTLLKYEININKWLRFKKRDNKA